jgi:hypothetical protein
MDLIRVYSGWAISSLVQFLTFPPPLFVSSFFGTAARIPLLSLYANCIYHRYTADFAYRIKMVNWDEMVDDIPAFDAEHRPRINVAALSAGRRCLTRKS